MEQFAISKTEAGLHIEGFPDAVKAIAVDGQEAKRLADLSLHKADLEFADTCLDAINQAPETPSVIREALWRSAVVHFLKCFGNGARFQLAPEKLYKGEPPEAFMAFSYFKGLRNKHLVHDENSYAQSIPGAVLNSGGKNFKIEKIVCFTAISSTLEQGNYGNLKLLIQKARAWVVSEFDSLCERLTNDLEKETYESLLARKSITYSVPNVDEIHHARKVP
jgi:hypothetical protein